jgi:drug/metabolite transporter (DMT)-like permease
VKSKIGVSECAVANSVVPFFIVPVMLFVIPEYKRWDKELIHPGDTYLTTVLSLLFIALCFSKHIDRLSKYGIVDESSTIFFAGVDAQMKMIAGVGSFFFFGEEITWTIIVGFGLIAVSVVIMFIDKIRKQHLIEAEKERQREKTRLEHAEAGHVHNVLVVR